MSWGHVMRLRCPKDTDPTRRADHVAYDVRLPLGLRALGKVTRSLSACACGSKLIITTDLEDAR